MLILVNPEWCEFVDDDFTVVLKKNRPAPFPHAEDENV